MTKRRLLQHEQEHQQKAFECYYALGDARSYKKVAGELGVSRHTIKLWAQSFAWRERVRERDAEVARKVADRAIQTNVDELGRNKKIVQMALVKLAKAIADGTAKLQASDLDRLIRLQAFLDGYAKDRPQSPSIEDVMAYVQKYLSQCSTAELEAYLAEPESGPQGPQNSPAEDYPT